MRAPRGILLALMAGVLAVTSGCHKTYPSATPSMDAGIKRYHIRGVVVSANAPAGQVTLDTEAIPGFMDAMTMPYVLKNPSVASELHPGDTITATLLASNTSDILDEIVIVDQAKPDYVPKVQYRPLTPGESIPDFKFLNQSNRMIHLSQFRGRVVLLTFIYTRCPLASYCPRMSRNFAEIDKALATDPSLYKKTHLLSISFDPTYDTPQVLRSYGGAYTGKYTKETFTHWDFAAPPQSELPKALNFFLIGVTPGENHTLTHSLSTLVITPQGKLYKWYPGNDWTSQQMLGDVKELLKDQPNS